MNTPAPNERSGFTFVELLVVIGVIALLGGMLLPALARTRPNTQAAQCLSNMRQLGCTFQLFAGDNADGLMSAADGLSGRSYWLMGPLQGYIGKSRASLKCPADQTTSTRCVSMNSAFGWGDWLDGFFGGATFSVFWRTYAKGSEIVSPAKTFVFADEHPGSINDGSLASACTGNQPADPPSASKIVDWPASYHDGAGSFCFADGRAELHKWIGFKIKAQISFEDTASGDSWTDMHWLAENTTVKR